MVFLLLILFVRSTAAQAEGAVPAEPFELIPGTVSEDQYSGDPADYPVLSGDVPAGCDAEGADLLIGERFAVASWPDRWVNSLRQIRFGGLEEVVVMEWDAIAPGCEEANVTLSVKTSHDTIFDMDTDQHALASVTCNGVGHPRCEDIGHRLVLPVSLYGVLPCFQIDAHLGRQLSVIGRSHGYYYSFLNGNHDVLISAKNGGFPPCTLDNPVLEGFDNVAIEVCPFDPDIPAGAKECRLIEPEPKPKPTTTTTMPTTTTAPALVARAVALTEPTLPITLPRTGANTTTDLARLGWMALAAGLLLEGVARRVVIKEA